MIALIDSKTKELAQGRQRLIHVDGHNSHITAELIDNAIASNIAVLGYPPHMTHLLQGLDVVSFSILKSLFYKEAKAFYERTGKEPNKTHIIDLLIDPITAAFSSKNIASAWRKTGIRPINPDIIPGAILRGSSIAVRPNAFPGLPPPSPIAGFIGAMRGQVQTLHIRPLCITTEPVASSSTELGPDLWPRKGNLPDPFKLLSEQLESLSMDDGTVTSASVIPQKAGTFAASLVNSLQGTSAAFLMHPRYISSSDRLPSLPLYSQPRQLATTLKAMPSAPTPELWDDFKETFEGLYARNQQLEAKVVLQEMHLEGITLKLGEKEKPRYQSNLQKVTGLVKNNIYTTPEVSLAAQKDQDKKVKDAADKVGRAKQRSTNKEAAEWRKQATQRKKLKQAELNTQYEEDCAEARSYGERKPKKPKAVPREATPTKFKRQAKDKEGTIEEEEEEEASSGSDDASYVE